MSRGPKADLRFKRTGGLSLLVSSAPKQYLARRRHLTKLNHLAHCRGSEMVTMTFVRQHAFVAFLLPAQVAIRNEMNPSHCPLNCACSSAQDPPSLLGTPTCQWCLVM